MARRRPAVHCSARRTNGEPCRNFAILGGSVCHAHGGRAPQVRQAAKRRLQMAAAMNAATRFTAERRTRQEAVAPWAPEIRVELAVGALDPAGSARRLRAIARQMTAVATELRTEARRLEAEAAEMAEAAETAHESARGPGT